jgi:hypothetical protein
LPDRRNSPLQRRETFDRVTSKVMVDQSRRPLDEAYRQRQHRVCTSTAAFAKGGRRPRLRL